MRIAIAAVLSFVMVLPAYGETGGFSKVELVQEMPMGGMKKLLGRYEGKVYYAKKDGSVGVVTMDGKELAALQAKDGKGKPVLRQPEDIAVANDVIYVADSNTDSIAMFSLDGGYKGSFGGRDGNADPLSSPSGIAVHDGIVYVADRGNRRVQLYGFNGVFLATLEVDSAPENKAAEEKDLPYRLDRPSDVEIDASGQIYVLDNDEMVKVYAPNGAYLRNLSGLERPVAISVARDGVYVADRDAFAVYKYDFKGKQLYSFGSKGKGRAQFRSMTGLATDEEMQVLAGDVEKGLVNVFKVEASPVLEASIKHTPRATVTLGQVVPAALGKIIWDGKGALYGIDESDRKNSRLIRIANGAVAGDIKLNDVVPVSIAFDRSGAIWALDGKKDRIVKLDGSGNVLLAFGGPGSGKGALDDAADLVVSSSGVIFVADTGNSRVQAFSSDGVFLKEIRNDLSGELDEPVAIALDDQDTIYVLDKGRRSISVFSSKGEPRSSFGGQDGMTALVKPAAITVSGNELFVLDADRVKVFSLKGQYVRSFSAPGSRSGNLADPQSIAAIGAEMLAIAERGNKRLQTFTVLHKPATPGKLLTLESVHSIEVRWADTTQPPVRQYRIYRSQNESSGFVQVGVSPEKRYVDNGLEPDRKYYYRIAGETQFGYIGPKSDSVSGVAKKYIPPRLSNIRVESSSRNIKFNWQPIRSEYFDAYQIYQKNGDMLVKVGETFEPEFVREGLFPETKYTFYLSASSIDDTESEKIELNVSTSQSTAEPLEIEVLKLSDVFSNTYKLYEQEGIGRIRLTNNTGITIEKIKLSFMLNTFMDFPTEGQIDRLSPGQSVEVNLKAVFNNNILTMTEDSSIQAQIEASHFLDGARKAYSRSATVTVYEKHRMTWDDHDRVASFVTPKDVPIINFSRAVATQFPETKDETQLAALLFNAMGVMGFTYIQNPTNPYQVSLTRTETTEKIDTVDYVQYPRETLERKSGDCVDLVTFYASSLEGLGIRTLMIEVPDHLLMMFSTGIKADADGYTMNNMYVVHEGMLWVPVEVTVVGRPFTKAWELGAQNYYKWRGRGLTILDVHNSWKIYKPATLPSSMTSAPEFTSGAFERKFPGDFETMLKISSQTRTRRYQEALQSKPDNLDAYLQIGIVKAKDGDHKEAMKYFDKILSIEPNHAGALNNRGNLLMLEGKYIEAQRAYYAAVKSEPGDAQIWVNLAKAFKATNNVKNAKEAFSRAQRLDPSVQEKYKALSLELLNTL